MRKLNFKAWSNKEQAWCGAFCVHKSGMVSDMIDAKTDKDSGVAISDAHWGENDLVVVLSTGVLDDYGMEIYEGSILSNSFQDSYPKQHSVVVWRNDRLELETCGSFRPLADNSGWCSIREKRYGGVEIIGHILEEKGD